MWWTGREREIKRMYGTMKAEKLAQLFGAPSRDAFIGKCRRWGLRNRYRNGRPNTALPYRYVGTAKP